jgi:acetolactate synthase-1/2/3 large subunit
VNKLYGSDSIIVCDIGLNKYYSGLLLEYTGKNQILFSNGMSSMAFSSGALGAKIAAPDRDVIVLVGDGGFLMDLQEVITAVQNEQNIIYIIFNNGGLGLVEQAQMKKEISHHGVKFGKVLFTRLANALGLKGIHVEKGVDLLPVLSKLKNKKQSAIIDVQVEYAAKR